MTIDLKDLELPNKISAKFSEADEKAKKLLSVMVCGSYKDETDLAVLERLRNKQREQGITTFLMKDVIIDEKLPLHEKFHYLWLYMKENDKVPLFIIFAGKSASESLGLNAEIQTIAHDKEKISCAYLFRFPGVNLVSHESCFTHVKIVKDYDEFVSEAEKVINSCISQIRMYYQAKKEGENI